MSDESIWKKEVSFERKAEPKDDAAQETPEAEEPTLVEPPAPDPEPESKESLWTREVSAEPAPSAETQPEPETKESLWTREVSAEPTPPVEDTAPAPVEAAETEPEPKESLWKREPSVEPTPPVEDATSPAAEVTPSEPESLWTRELSFSPSAPDDEPVAPEPVAAEPVFDAPTASTETESWTATPAPPPEPEVVEPVVVHPPVPAAELPALPDAEAKVPFWKKDLSFGGGKKSEKEKAAKVEEPASDNEPKVPFWKKDLSFGGSKKPKAEKKEKAAKAEKSVSTEPKVPFWKKDLALGGKSAKPKAPKAKRQADSLPDQPKAAKVKRPKVKLERGSKSGSKRLVGLKIGASQLAAARVSNNGTAELQQVARGALEPGIVVGGELRDPDALSEALKEFFATHGLPKRGVRLGIANNRIGVRTFEITGIADPKQLANAVRFRAQEALPIPIEDAVLDYQVLSEGVTAEGEPTRKILLVVAYRELIDRYVDACKKAGITLTGIDLEAFALLRALQAPQDGVEGDPSAALVAVAIGHERATFAVSDGRVCEFTRVLDWGGSALNVAIARVLDAAPSEVEAAKRALALTDEMVPEGLTPDQAQRAREAMRRAIQAFARELVSSLQYYQNQPGSLGIGEIVLTGGTAHLPGLAGELERLIGVRVRVGDPLARMKIAKKVGEPEQVGSLAVAIGLGIED